MRLVLEPLLRFRYWLINRRVRRADLITALESAEQTLRWADRLPEGRAAEQWRATFLNVIGFVRLEIGDLRGARTAFEESLWIEEELDPKSPETARGLNNLASVAYHQGELHVAQARYEQAIALRAAIDPMSLDLADSLSAAGQVLSSLGRADDAFAMYERALAITTATEPDSSAHAGVLTNKATLLLNRGALDEARSLFRLALDIETAADPRSPATATAWSNIGLVSHALGDIDHALSSFQRALEIDMAYTPEAPRTAADHNNIAIILLDLERFDEAIEHLTEALRIEQWAAPSSSATATAFLNVGYAHQLAGRPAAAVDDYRRALGIDAAIARSSRDVAFDLTNLGTAEHQVGNNDDAVHLLKQAVAMFEKFELPADGSQAGTNLAFVLGESGQIDAAIDAARRACAAAERARVLAGHPDTREKLFALNQSPFSLLLDMLHTRRGDNDGDEAFAVAEAARARSLADLLGERPIRSSLRDGAMALRLQEELALHRELLDARARLASGRTDAQAVRDLEDQLAECRHRLRQDAPQYANAVTPEPVSASEARSQLSDDTLLLSYAESTARLHLWATRRHASAHVTLNISAADVVPLVDFATAAYRRGEPGGDEEALAQAKLAELLLEPIPEALTADVRNVVIVPCGRLFHLPFEMLPWQHGVLGDVVAISYVPSVSVLHHGIRPDQAVARPFVGYAPTSLPGARTEVRRVAEVLGASPQDVHTGATKEIVAKTISGAQQVYFATHGLLDDQQPMQSGLWCTPVPGVDDDPVLRAFEIIDLRIDADVVVCSACESGLGRLLAGEGLVGLSRALFFAGARCLIVSLWPTPDIPTRRLIVRFAELMRDGSAPAVALRLAKEQMRESHPQTFATPWTWAGFVVIGAAVS
ncbi:CHAT domain-containing protein [Kibdelosporangium aridum]|uniref:Tetratricopeptide repeat-containing protein n=1 Tax=Kibdelosporangium aridum TaxID=2030 RepID=A0A1W2G0Q6_KIBAR|nr:CHAT domain-containing tetratricopeptide repeat protein [Kibdelosporangium aridum]SMD27478.1 Tetratricopeptide repeat-containing protein [Kibdelosporangium aridum]